MTQCLYRTEFLLWLWATNYSFWAGSRTVNTRTYPWPHRLSSQTGCALQWRMAKCWCCFGGSWTWEEDWRWCLERLNVRGNSGRSKKRKALISSIKMVVCEREKAWTYLFSELKLSFWHLPGCDGVKVTVGGRDRDKERTGSICGLPVMPCQVKQADRREQIKHWHKEGQRCLHW